MDAERKTASTGHDLVALCRFEDLPGIDLVLRASPEASAWSTDALAETLRRHGPYFFAARWEQGIAGFICGRKVANEAEILNLAVRPGVRRHGIGAALLSKLLHTFTLESAAQVFLEVRESNAAAISFYKHFGFHQIGKRAGYYENPQESALVLSRSLL